MLHRTWFAALCFRLRSCRQRLNLYSLLLLLIAAQFAAPTAHTQPASSDPQPRVVDGNPADIEKFPSLVAVTGVLDDGRGWFCGGTVIDPVWVLTAAHCVFNPITGKLTEASAFHLLEGSDNLHAGGHALFVDRVVPHPGYNAEIIANDIALLHLVKPSQVPPQMLASRAARESLTSPGTSSTVVGWGDTADHRESPVPGGGYTNTPLVLSSVRDVSMQLLQASMPIVSVERCRRAYPSTPETEWIRSYNICAGLEEGGVSSCHGDSGGPLFTQHKTAGSVQVGVVSWGAAGCARPGKFSVFTSVGDFELFIREHVPNASLATESNDSPGTTTDGPFGEAQPPHMPPPGETPQVTVDILPAGPIRLGTPVTVRVSSSDTGVLMLFTRDADGHVTQLFPNRYAKPNPSALSAGKEILAGATMTVPGLADGFRIKAQPPLGETAVIAIVAPREAKVLDLIERHQNLEVIDDWDAFVGQLADRLHAASLAKAAGDPSSRALGVEQSRPAIAIAERHFNVQQ